MQAPNCLNCEQPVLTSQKFCPNCGQKVAVHRLTLHDVGHDAMHYFTHADKGIFSLLRHLITKPGVVAREYVEGKRRKYFPPINFFLIVAAFYVFMMSIVTQTDRAALVSPQEHARFEKIKDPETKAQVAKILERRVKSTSFITKYSNFIAMVATPLISFFLWLFYHKGKYNYTEHLVANMYISGFTVLCFALLFAPLMKLIGTGWSNLILFNYFVFEITYRAISYYYFFNKGTRASAIKATVCATAVILIWFIITYTSIFLYIGTGFFGLVR